MYPSLGLLRKPYITLTTLSCLTIAVSPSPRRHVVPSSPPRLLIQTTARKVGISSKDRCRLIAVELDANSAKSFSPFFPLVRSGEFALSRRKLIRISRPTSFVRSFGTVRFPPFPPVRTSLCNSAQSFPMTDPPGSPVAGAVGSG